MRNEQLKQIFAQALDKVLGDKEVKHLLRYDMTKFEITNVLQQAGVSNASDTAQRIIRTGNSLDK